MHGANQYATGLTRARLADGARLNAGSVELGGKLVRNEIEIRLEGLAAETEIAGLALTRGKQHCDARIAVDHRAPRTTSRQNYRAIADGESRSVFNGKVTVREGAQHIDARQRNDNLLLSAHAEVDTKPELEIYADQVACSHGATVGEISEDQLFYLRARGIGEKSARAILTSAFAAEILERLPFEYFRKRAQAAVLAWMPTDPAAGE
jgi:Fe-S cluster assembly protein SufD